MLAMTNLSGMDDSEAERDLGVHSRRGARLSSASLDAVALAAHQVVMTITADESDSPPSLEGAIFALCNAAASGRTIGPEEAARAYASARGEDDLGWRAHLTEVRRVAVRLAEAGRIVIYRKGKPVDPREFRGVYRLGLPRHD